MIVTLTLNPAADQTLWVGQVDPGGVHRVLDCQIDPAGKGINVSRMVHRLGWPTVAFGFLAGDIGNIVESALHEEGVQHHFVRISGQTRLNVTIVDAAGTATSFFGPGPSVQPEGISTLDSILDFWLHAARVLVIAGSLPPAVPESAYAEYVRAARKRGVKVILDADGEAMQSGVGATPDLIKPNVAEAERLLQRSLPDETAVAVAGRELIERGIETVVISMGARGAICTTRERAWRARPPAVKRRSNVGSGDSMVAGIAVALARGDDIVTALTLGTAAGAATAASTGTRLGTAEDVSMLLPGVAIEDLE